MNRSSRALRACRILALVIGAGLAASASAGPVDDKFTYQGELQVSGTPANGSYDFRFRLYDALAGGSQIGAQVNQTRTVTNGRFTTTLQFAGAFAGQDRWLEIEASVTGSGIWMTLSPRQLLSAAPNAAYALNAGAATTAATATNALNLGGQLPAFYTNANNLSSGTLNTARLTGSYTGSLSFTNVANTYFGSGANLTALNATNISSGTLADARLSTNVDLLNAAQAFSAIKTFTVAPAFTAAGAPFTVSSGTVVTNLNADMVDGLHASAFALASHTHDASAITTGTLSDARLSANVALLNLTQTFTAPKTFSSSDPLTIVDTSAGGWAVDLTNNGGTSVHIVNDASTNGLAAYGVYSSVNGTATRYAVDTSVLGTTGTGYNIYGSNSAATGRGAYFTLSGTGTCYGVYVSNSSTSGYGGYFNNTATTGTTYGVYAENNSPDGYALYALHDASTGTGSCVYARTDSTTGLAYAVHGVVNSTSAGASSAGIRGENLSTTGFGIGVHGSQAGSGYGVFGTVVSGGYGVYGYSSGAGYGVRGYSTSSYGGYFDTGVAGGAALYVVGTASVGVITIRGGADLAENFEVTTRADEVQPGMLVMIDPDHEGGVMLARGTYNKCVAGVVSGANDLKAGMVMGQFDGQKDGKPIALSGRVWTYVDATDAAVEPGDLLTTSDTPGYAMPVIDRQRAQGATIGKSMSRLARGEKGMVLVLVNLQ